MSEKDRAFWYAHISGIILGIGIMMMMIFLVINGA